MDLSQIRAGGNTSTFDADARCPTCRPLVPYIKGKESHHEMTNDFFMSI